MAHTYHYFNRKPLPQRIGQALWRERWIGLLTLPLFMGAAIYQIRQIPSVYQSRAEILIESQQSTEKLVSAVSAPAGIGRLDAIGFRANPISNQLALVKSRALFNRAMKAADLKAPYSGFSANTISGTDVIQIRYQSESPEKSQQVVEAVTDLYIEENLAGNRQKASTARQFLEERLPSLEEELRTAQDQLQAFQNQYTFLGTSSEIQNSSEAVNQLQRRINDIQADLSFTTQKIDSLKSQLPANLTSALRVAGLLQDPAYQRLRNELLDAEATLANLRSRYTEANPQVLAAVDKRDQIQAMLDQTQASLLGEQVEAVDLTLDPVRRNLVEEWFNLEVDRGAQEARLNQLTLQLGAFTQRLDQLPELIKQHSRLRTEVDKAEQTFLAFADRLTASQLIEQQSLGNVRVIEPARLNRSPIAPQRDVLYAMATVVSLAVTLGLVGLKRLFSNTLEPGDLIDCLPIPVLAVITSGSKGRLLQATQAETTHLLSRYQVLQAHLRMLPRHANVIGVCSWTDQEGSATVAENLALLEAQAGRRVLLIDTKVAESDPPRFKRFQPAAAEAASSTQLPTLDDILANSSRSGLQGFDILMYHVATTLLFYKKWSQLLDRLRKKYDLIVIDSPPLEQGAAATLLASMSDGMIWVSSPPMLGRKGATAAAAAIQNWETRLLGQVILESPGQSQALLRSVGTQLQSPGDETLLPGGSQ